MTDFLLLSFIFLIAGVISVPIASRLGLGSVLGYLIAGIVISPILGWLGVDVISIQHFAEFGVVMMLFLVGLELQPKALWDMRGKLIGLGGGQVVLTALAVMGVTIALGQTWQISLAIGLVFALSSTAIVLQTLGEKGLLKSDGGQGSFSVLLTQDIAVIPMLALLPLLAMPELADMGADLAHSGEDAAHGGDSHGEPMSLVAGLNGWQTALVTLGAVGFVVVGGSLLTGPLFRFIASANLRELFTATALMMVIGIALLMSLVGLSPALGTFLAGVVLANSAYRHELESDIDPFRGLLLGLFFMTVGAGVNFTLLGENLGAVLVLTLGLMALKAVILIALAYVFRIKGADKWLMALSLAQAGEFGFVLLSFTVANNVLPPALSDLLLLVVALSMLLTPALFILYDRVIAPRYAASEAPEADTMPEDAKIIIAGAGRVGGLVDRVLRAAGHETTVIDYSSRKLEVMAKFGAKIYFGDATRPDLLAAAGLGNAKVLIVAIDDRDGITQIVEYAHKTYPDLHIIARACDRDHVYDLWFHGCRDIIRETYDSTLRMGRSAFQALGVEAEAAQAMVDAFNAHDRKAMIEVASVHKVGVAPHENPDYVAKVAEMRDDMQTALRADMDAIRDGRPSGAQVAGRTSGAQVAGRKKGADMADRTEGVEMESDARPKPDVR
ncbi:cation:proton antiporter [Rhodobacteraceae bacterium N5(2021)]|uniref:Cation:proton antiporter n=1 Tax=Gymnodinialimonas phycosphaerae TaxID=2841589 RepID=A0A975YHU5_9RHOB|nr:cation:proton antiporter [Gymnodinialimonas phycosphaerae]MBY4893140.1 cation:proton antiporter [Gymnodinialimonas phycosphaerae]